MKRNTNITIGLSNRRSDNSRRSRKIPLNTRLLHALPMTTCLLLKNRLTFFDGLQDRDVFDRRGFNLERILLENDQVR